MTTRTKALLAAILLAAAGSITLPIYAEGTPELPEEESPLAAVELNEDENVRSSGSCGTYVTYTWYKNGDMVISGTGDMTDYTAFNDPHSTGNRSPWAGWREYYQNGYAGYWKYYYPYKEIYKIAFEGRITGIGDYIFSECENIKGELTLPTTLKRIGKCSFHSCSGFTGPFLLPAQVATIDVAAFYGCSGFSGNLYLPDSVTQLGGSAFSGCSGLDGTLHLPAGITVINASTFKNCENLNGSLLLPDQVTEIGDEAFSGCKGFTGRLTIPESVVSIGNSAFAGCTGFSDVLFEGDAPETIGESIFGSRWGDLMLYCYASHADSFTSDDNYDAYTETWHGYPLEILADIPTVIPGDIDGDGRPATPKDAMVLARYIAGWDGYEDMIVLEAADLDGDGKPATPKDAMILARHIAGWEGYETLPLK